MKSVTKSVRYTTRRLRGWRDILGREQNFVVFVFVFHVKQQFLLLIRQLKPSRNALCKQADAETEQKKDANLVKRLDMILFCVWHTSEGVITAREILAERSGAARVTRRERAKTALRYHRRERE